MLIKVQSPYVPIDIEIGDEVVHVYVNTTVDGLTNIANRCYEAAQKFDEKQPIVDEATKANDIDTILAINDEIATIAEGAIRSAIGDGYDRIMAALANTAPEFKPSDANHVMIQVMDAVLEIVKDAKAEMLNNKAAHYLSEVSNAQVLADV